jgi:hypothetical protein
VDEPVEALQLVLAQLPARQAGRLHRQAVPRALAALVLVGQQLGVLVALVVPRAAPAAALLGAAFLAAGGGGPGLAAGVGVRRKVLEHLGLAHQEREAVAVAARRRARAAAAAAGLLLLHLLEHLGLALGLLAQALLLGLGDLLWSSGGEGGLEVRVGGGGGLVSARGFRRRVRGSSSSLIAALIARRSNAPWARAVLSLPPLLLERWTRRCGSPRAIAARRGGRTACGARARQDKTKQLTSSSASSSSVPGCSLTASSPDSPASRLISSDSSPPSSATSSSYGVFSLSLEAAIVCARL